MSCLGAFPLTWVENTVCFTGVFHEHGCLAAAMEMCPIIPLSMEGLFCCRTVLRAVTYN